MVKVKQGICSRCEKEGFLSRAAIWQAFIEGVMYTWIKCVVCDNAVPNE